MANGVFNVALGRVNDLHERVNDNDPATCGLVVVLLKTAEADATLKDYDTLAALLAGSNVEADFTNYARKVLVNTDVTATTVDDGADTRSADIPDQTWTAAGGTTDNTMAKLIICYAPNTGGADSTFIPLTFHDYVVTTDGSDLLAQFHVDGYYSAT